MSQVRPQSPSRRHTHAPGAFSLLELLVVIVLITLLVAILLPLLKSARLAGQTIVCKSNLRQNYIGFASYASDFQDTMPPVGYAAAVTGPLDTIPGGEWFHFLGKGGYLGAMETYTGSLLSFPITNTRFATLQCPAEPGSAKIAGMTYYNDEMAMTSFAMNWSVSGYHYYFGYDFWTTPGDIHNEQYFRRGFTGGSLLSGAPSDARLVVDNPQWGVGFILPYYISDIDYNYDGYFDYAFRHPGNTIDVLYLDGHAGSEKSFNETGVPLWRYTWKRCPEWGWGECYSTSNCIWISP